MDMQRMEAQTTVALAGGGPKRKEKKTTGIQTKENREDRKLEAFKTPVGQVLSMEPPSDVLWSFRTRARIFYKV